jgi:hypothetical protein
MSADPRGWRMDPGRQLVQFLARWNGCTCSEGVAVNDGYSGCIGISNINNKSSRFSSCKPVIVSPAYLTVHEEGRTQK